MDDTETFEDRQLRAKERADRWFKQFSRARREKQRLHLSPLPDREWYTSVDPFVDLRDRQDAARRGIEEAEEKWREHLLFRRTQTAPQRSKEVPLTLSQLRSRPSVNAEPSSCAAASSPKLHGGLQHQEETRRHEVEAAEDQWRRTLSRRYVEAITALKAEIERRVNQQFTEVLSKFEEKRVSERQQIVEAEDHWRRRISLVFRTALAEIIPREVVKEQRHNRQSKALKLLCEQEVAARNDIENALGRWKRRYFQEIHGRIEQAARSQRKDLNAAKDRAAEPREDSTRQLMEQQAAARLKIEAAWQKWFRDDEARFRQTNADMEMVRKQAEELLAQQQEHDRSVLDQLQRVEESFRTEIEAISKTWVRNTLQHQAKLLRRCQEQEKEKLAAMARNEATLGMNDIENEETAVRLSIVTSEERWRSHWLDMEFVERRAVRTVRRPPPPAAPRKPIIPPVYAALFDEEHRDRDAVLESEVQFRELLLRRLRAFHPVDIAEKIHELVLTHNSLRGSIEVAETHWRGYLENSFRATQHRFR